MDRTKKHPRIKLRKALICRLACNPHLARLSSIKTFRQDSGYDWNEWQHHDSLLNRSIDDFHQTIEAGITRVSVEDADRLRDAIGSVRTKFMPARPICSHARIRRIAKEALYNVLRSAWLGPSGTRRRWISITAITDLGNSLEYNPTIEMYRVKRQIRKAIAELGLNAVMVLETQSAVRYPGGNQGGTLMTHAHGIAYTDDPTFDLGVAQSAARKRQILFNWLGAPTVCLKPIETKGALARACYYLNKYPVKASRLVPDRTKRSGFRTVHQNVEVGAALRLAELLSMVEYRDLTFGTGGGVKLKGDWLRVIDAGHRGRAKLVDIDLEPTWKRLWSAKRVDRKPFDLRWTARRPSNGTWARGMKGWCDAHSVTRPSLRKP